MTTKAKSSPWHPIRCQIKAGECCCRCPYNPPCPEWRPFDRSSAVGEMGWIVRDMTVDPVLNTSCARCGKEFEGRNIAVECGAILLAILDRDLNAEGSFKWEDCYTMAPTELDTLEMPDYD